MTLRSLLLPCVAFCFLALTACNNDDGDNDTTPAPSGPANNSASANVGGTTVSSPSSGAVAGTLTATGSDTTFFFATSFSTVPVVQVSWISDEFVEGTFTQTGLTPLLQYTTGTLSSPIEYESTVTSASVTVTSWSPITDGGKFTGTYSGTVYNTANPDDSLVITNGVFTNVEY